MSHKHSDKVPCAEPGCTQSYDAHRWGTMRAQSAGWFLQKDGVVWCPDHNPGWVADWRKRQAHYRDEVLDIEGAE